MKTDELIHLLAKTAPPRPAVPFYVVAFGLPVSALLVTAFALGLRPEFAAGVLPYSFYFKTAFFAACVFTVLAALGYAAKPMPSPRWPARAFYLLLTGLIVAALYELSQAPLETLHETFILNRVEVCLLAVTLYGGAGALAFGAYLRRFAPADAGQAAGWMGLAAALCGALGYSVHCQSDSALFILLAYGGPCLMITLLARLFGERFLRW